MAPEEEHADLIPEDIRVSLDRALEHGVPARSLAVAARWWQLETWLRQLVYLELRAAYGLEWISHISKKAKGRAAADELNSYMRTPDASSVLAYLDVGELFRLIDDEEYWPLFEPSLLPRVRWRGAVDELAAVRHRFAHCRRPHVEDVSRIESVLRDLETGAWKAISAYHATRRPLDPKRDP
jgi:Swt1-like HEPN